MIPNRKSRTVREFHEYIFPSVAKRDVWMDNHFPARKALTAPGLYRTENGYLMVVFLTTVQIFSH